MKTQCSVNLQAKKAKKANENTVFLAFSSKKSLKANENTMFCEFTNQKSQKSQ